MNHSKFMKIQYICQFFCPTCFIGLWSQFLTSHAIFNCHAYTQRVDQIISCKFSSFSIHDVASFGMLLTPQALRPNTYNNSSKANLTKVGLWEWWTLFCNNYQLIPLVLCCDMNTINSLLIFSHVQDCGIS